MPLAVPNVRVDAAAVWVPGARVDVPGHDLCRVVRRREFDAALEGRTSRLVDWGARNEEVLADSVPRVEIVIWVMDKAVGMQHV